MFCIKICFWEPEPVGAELLHIGEAGAEIFFPGAGAEKMYL